MIRVTLINPASRRFYLAQWDDPVTGLTKTRSTKSTELRKAERFAANLETELNAGTYAPPMRTTWAEFCARYLSEVSSAKKGGTREKTEGTMNLITELINPQFLAAMADPNVVSRFAAKLRSEPIPSTAKTKRAKASSALRKPRYRSAATIDGHLREVRKMLIWATRMKLINERPHIEFPRFDDSMKGRPVTGEEFDRMLAKVTVVVPAEFAAGWTHFLRGLRLSGFRLDESMKLHWTDDRNLCVDFSRRRPMFRIQAKSEKGKQFRFLPMTPDFAEFLAETPVGNRRGFVFSPMTHPPGPIVLRTGPHRPTAKFAGRVVTEIGRAAGVFVSSGKPASSHDLRRAFGFEWCQKVMPKVLQELMRHERIQTTMQFYVGAMAEDAAEAIWKASGNTFGNSLPETRHSSDPEHSQNP